MKAAAEISPRVDIFLDPCVLKNSFYCQVNVGIGRKKIENHRLFFIILIGSGTVSLDVIPKTLVTSKCFVCFSSAYFNKRNRNDECKSVFEKVPGCAFVFCR